MFIVKLILSATTTRALSFGAITICIIIHLIYNNIYFLKTEYRYIPLEIE